MKKILGNKKVLISGIVVILVLIIGGIYFANKKNTKTQSQGSSSIQNETAIPTVDASVKVTLEALPGKKEVRLSVENMPNGTKTLEYELSYEARNQGPQGVITQPIDVSGQNSYEKTITLGTCSSGTCVYHDVVSNISLSLKFTGSYGQRIFEKEFPL
jgi:hypothetical protein